MIHVILAIAAVAILIAFSKLIWALGQDPYVDLDAMERQAGGRPDDGLDLNDDE